MSEDVTRDLPADLAAALRDQSVVVSRDAALFELLAEWAKAPSLTASAEISFGADGTGDVFALSAPEPSTTPTAC